MNVAQDKDKREQARSPLRVDADDAPGSRGGDTYDEMQRASKRGSLFQRFGARFQEAIESSRGTGEEEPDPLAPMPSGEPVRIAQPLQASAPPPTSMDDVAMRRAKDLKVQQRTVVPDGVIITGSITSNADTEISGKIDGDVIVEGRLYLGPTALVTGNVRAATCKVEGLVDGKVECSQDLEIGESGRLKADAMAGRKILLAGEVTGNVGTGGLLRLLSTARIAGDIRARSIVIEEGAFFNGKCVMRQPSEKQAQKE